MGSSGCRRGRIAWWGARAQGEGEGGENHLRLVHHAARGAHDAILVHVLHRVERLAPLVAAAADAAEAARAQLLLRHREVGEAHRARGAVELVLRQTHRRGRRVGRAAAQRGERRQDLVGGGRLVSAQQRLGGLLRLG